MIRSVLRHRRLAGSALALVICATLLPACGLLGGGGTYTLTAYFDRAVSVFPSSDVRILGLPAGEVSEVKVEGDKVRIEMKISDDIHVPADATAQIVPQSLIGERYIQLSPAFKEGMEAAKDGDVIENTVIPVEPDEALAALKEFLDSLDPDGLGTLVGNLEENLRGNGAQLNDTLGSLSDLVENFAENDDVLLRIVDSFDTLTATLATREQQLGEVMDAFAQASQVLADERQSIESLVAGLADLSQAGLALLGEHAGPLRDDIATLAATAATIEANLGSVTQLLAAGPQLSDGIVGAYNPQLRALNLRNNFGYLTVEVAKLLGLDICLPILQDCPDGGILGLSAPDATPADLSAPSPIAALTNLLGSPLQEPVASEPGLAGRARERVSEALSVLVGVAP